MKHFLIETLGWLGIIAILASYLCISFELLTATTLLYQLLNLFGALCMIIVSLPKKNYQPVVLNLIWIGIALISISQIILNI